MTTSGRILSVGSTFESMFLALSGYFAYTGQEKPAALKKIESTAKEKIKEGARKSVDKVQKVADD